MYDPFVAFFVGVLAGGSLGIIVASIMAAARQSEEQRERDLRQYAEEDNYNDQI